MLTGKKAWAIGIAVAFATSWPAGAFAEEVRPHGWILVNRYFAHAQQADLFLMRPGHAARRLTKSRAFESSAIFSPDGEQIVFVRRSANKQRFSLMVMRRDGSDVRLLALGAGTGVTWSPDSHWITFVRSVSASESELVVVSSDGSDEKVLATAPLIYHALDWAPDSSQIVFSQRLEAQGSAQLDLYAVSPNGGAQTRLTDSPGEDVFPSFSPVGDRIVFSSDRDDFVPEDGDPTSSELFVMDSDGSNQVRLTTTPSTWDESPTWSPASENIAFSRRYDDDVRSGPGSDSDIVLIDATEGSRQVLTHDRTDDDRLPLWSPDGRWVAFNRESATGSVDICIVRSDGAARFCFFENNGRDDYVSDWWIAAQEPLLHLSRGGSAQSSRCSGITPQGSRFNVSRASAAAAY